MVAIVLEEKDFRLFGEVAQKKVYFIAFNINALIM